MVALSPELQPELEFWCSTRWVDIWAGVPLRLPPTTSAAGLTRKALKPGTTVNFPQITEICERIQSAPAEVEDAVRVLVYCINDMHAPFKTKLKALTISNEMMYDERAVAAFHTVAGFQECLATLRGARDTGLGSATDENIRMLATEIDRVCFGGGIARSRASQIPAGFKRLGAAMSTPGSLMNMAGQS
mmetsp:Transcript_56437/g.132373  ORF Transcript_56437/g.132373 Transcript_56437/m.132373 type:complete len:189 (-) Transcript_56437:33-599(-)